MFSGLPFEADLDLRVNEYTCPCRKLDSAIMVMKSAEDRLSPLTNDPECRGMLLSEALEWLQEARHRGSTLPLLADLILDVTSGEAEKLSSR
jgi:hypothetical protein